MTKQKILTILKELTNHDFIEITTRGNSAIESALSILRFEFAITATEKAVNGLILFEIANAFNFRSFRYPVYKLPFFANRYLVYASLASITATIAIIYSPLNAVFGTSPISIYYWILALVSSLFIIFVFDILKIRKFFEE